MYASAASLNVLFLAAAAIKALLARFFSSFGSMPCLIVPTIFLALSLASAMPTVGYEPNPKCSRSPAMRTRRIHDLDGIESGRTGFWICNNNPAGLPTACIPALESRFTSIALNSLAILGIL